MKWQKRVMDFFKWLYESERSWSLSKFREPASEVGDVNLRREAEVEAGNFVYYVVDEGTNSRTMHDGAPIVYATREIAEIDREGYDEVISVAAYNRLYGRFMNEDQHALK